MLETPKTIYRHRELLSTLVARDLKARYRGSVLGFVWSLVNPLLLLGVYAFVFGYVLGTRIEGISPYALFLIAGLFPWVWASTSLLESTMSLTVNAPLIRKAVFPVELLPIVSVVANLVHFLFALPILALALVIGRSMGFEVAGLPVVALPGVIALQLIFLSGAALGLGALNVHFKDVRDLLANLLTLLFFLAPIIYPITAIPERFRLAIRLNPFTPYTEAYQDLFFFGRWPEPQVWATMAGLALVKLADWQLAVRSAVRDPGGGGMSDPPEGQPHSSDVALRVHGLGKRYRRTAAGYRLRTLKSALLDRSLVRGLDSGETIEALRGVSFEVARGEAFGVIGGNGSGKSTLLKMVSGLLQPTVGSVEARGRVAALIELGAGFHPEISGRENIFINGSVLGLDKRQIRERYDSIVEFSGLGDFLEEPVKNYSSGMYVRLGFAVAIHTDPDILLVDEVLSVGDEAFGRRCLRAIEGHLAQGGTLLVVSHSLDLVEHLCDRVLWLDQGRVRDLGEPRRVIDHYRESVAQDEGRASAQGDGEPSPGDPSQGDPDRWGSGVAEIEEIQVRVGAGDDEVESTVFESGSPVAFEITARAHERLDDFVFGVMIKTPRGVECFGTNTDLGGREPVSFEDLARVRLSCPSLELAAGTYRVDVAVHARDGTPYDYLRDCITLTVTSRRSSAGIYLPRHRWASQGGIEWGRLDDAPSDHEAGSGASDTASEMTTVVDSDTTSGTAVGVSEPADSPAPSEVDESDPPRDE